MQEKEIFLEISYILWYFMDRLFKRQSHIPHASGLLAGCPDNERVCGGMIDAAVKPKGGTSCPRLR